MTASQTTPRQNFLAIPRASFRYPFPSPLQKLARLTDALGGAQVWAKRDDTNSPLAAGGGNKVRKLEYLVQDALDKGCETLVSIGGIQSNHTRAVGSVAVAAGLKCVTVQETWVPGQEDNAVYSKVGNIQLNRLMGTDVRLVDAGFDIAHRPSLKAVFDEVEAKGGKPYYIPAGASDHELGAMGFVGFLLELEQQEEELGIHFDTVIVCSVTGSSQAGIIVGAAIEADEGRPARKVIGIDASAKPAQTKAQVRKIAQATADKLGLGRALTEKEVLLDERFHAGVYGLADEETLAAMELGARTDGMITDPVYEGKSLAGLIKLVRDGEVSRESNVLYVHLGGQAALSAYPDLIK